MLHLLPRLRLPRLLAVLAVLLMTGLGQHVHAAGAPVYEAALTLSDGSSQADEEGNGTALPQAAHCGFCDATRGVMPAIGRVHQPATDAVAMPALKHDTVAALIEPDGPSRPPRPRHAA
jgi:hypothetical protein